MSKSVNYKGKEEARVLGKPFNWCIVLGPGDLYLIFLLYSLYAVGKSEQFHLIKSPSHNRPCLAQTRHIRI